MSIYHSRHTRYSKKTVPHKKRSIQLYGEGKYRNKLWRCWYCGFINNSDRNIVAATYQGGDSNIVFEVDDLLPTSFATGDSRYVTITLDFPFSINLMQLESDGSIMAPDVPHSTLVTKGCSFCGSLNYR